MPESWAWNGMNPCFILQMMEERGKKYCSVSDVCRMYGITRKTLFYYDRHDILKPSVRRGEQAHKYYSEQDLLYLEQILKYRNAGLKLEEITQLIYDPDCRKNEVFDQAEERIFAEIEKNRRYLKELRKMKEAD